jgi:hypothetical protein
MAGATATINFGSTTAIPANNNFQSFLAALGLTRYAAGAGTSISLDANSIITFYFLGSESGFNDTFQTTNALPNLLTTESSSIENHFAPNPSVLIGSDTFAAGSLANQLLFTNNGGANGTSATVGQSGFGLFLGPNTISGSTTNTFYFGYDDQAYNPDGDYDDFIVKAVVTSAVPEPATWAMMLLGFGAIGFSMRRRKMLPKLAKLA